MALTPEQLKRFSSPEIKDQTERRKDLIRYTKQYDSLLLNDTVGMCINFNRLNVEEAIILNEVFDCKFALFNNYDCYITMDKNKWEEFKNTYVDYSLKPDFQL